MKKDATELLFVQSVLKDKPLSKIVYPTSDQDQFEHWDVQIDGIKYDVKARKHVHRNDGVFTDDIHIEIINVRGKDGWARGKADYIAFEQEHRFLIVPTRSIYLLAINNLKPKDGFGYYERHTRFGKQDLVTLAPLADVLKLNHIFLKK